jgi:hypothetical protein
MLLLAVRAQDAVKAGFRGQISPLIGQFRNNLAGWEAGKFLAIADCQNGGAFFCAKLVARLWTLDQGALVSLNLTAPGPAAQCPYADFYLGAGFGAA